MPVVEQSFGEILGSQLQKHPQCPFIRAATQHVYKPLSFQIDIHLTETQEFDFGRELLCVFGNSPTTIQVDIWLVSVNVHNF